MAWTIRCTRSFGSQRRLSCSARTARGAGRLPWTEHLAATLIHHRESRARRTTVSGPLRIARISMAARATLWIGALATDKAKIEDLVEAAYDVPAGMFRDAGRKLYEEGVALAELWQEAVSRSVKAYAATLKLGAAALRPCAGNYFWTTHRAVRSESLLKLAGDPEKAGDLQVSEWGKRVKGGRPRGFRFCLSAPVPAPDRSLCHRLAAVRLPAQAERPRQPPRRERQIHANRMSTEPNPPTRAARSWQIAEDRERPGKMAALRRGASRRHQTRSLAGNRQPGPGFRRSRSLHRGRAFRGASRRIEGHS